jgi:hypothetical protein
MNLAGSWNHVGSRGNGGEVLFCDDTDRRRFLGLVSELPERISLEVHAFVLMNNRRLTALRGTPGVPGGCTPVWNPGPSGSVGTPLVGGDGLALNSPRSILSRA